MILLLLACAQDPDLGGEVVTMETRDGVDLAADWYFAGPGRPALLLLHMNPESYDRTSWPVDFLRRLIDERWSVLVPDRRGNGESGGEPRDAFVGDAGRYDVEAGMLFLGDEDTSAIGILAASNGTTSQVDYCSWAPAEGLPQADATGFMTGGNATENQTPMEDFAALAIPAVFTFSTLEREWSVEQQALDPGSWTFHEYADGDHGTKMFDAAPEVTDDLVDFYDSVLGTR